MNNLALYDMDQLTPEELMDQYHPANDQFMTHARSLQRSIVGASQKLKPLQVRAIKMAHNGDAFVDIGQELGVSPQTVGKWVKLPDALRLKALLAHYATLMDGPNEAQRRAMLWRMAVKNEDVQERISISALAELNKMTIADYDRNKGSAPQTTTIVINQQLIQRTALDD